MARTASPLIKKRAIKINGVDIYQESPEIIQEVFLFGVQSPNCMTTSQVCFDGRIPGRKGLRG